MAAGSRRCFLSFRCLQLGLSDVPGAWRTAPSTVSRNLGGKCTLLSGFAENQGGGPLHPQDKEGAGSRLR